MAMTDKNVPPSEEGNWYNQLIDESDVGCVLIAQSMLEEKLGDLIEFHIRSSESAAKEFLRRLRRSRVNPLGSFGQSVDYAESMGWITKNTSAAFRAINAVRIAFAHYKPPRKTRLDPDRVRGIVESLTKKQLGGVGAILKAFESKRSKRVCIERPSRSLFVATAIALIFELERGIGSC
jgi:hypothetical protein